MSKTGEERFRLIVLGDNKTGKTCIIRRYLNGSFSERYKETMEDVYSRDFSIRGAVLPLDIYDTNVKNTAARKLHIAIASAFLLVFRLDNEDSFKTVQTIMTEISESQLTDATARPTVIVGNQNDLEHKVIAPDSVEALLASSEFHNVKYLETSAKTGENITEIFQTLLNQSGFPHHRKMSGSGTSFARVKSMRCSKSTASQQSAHPQASPLFSAGRFLSLSVTGNANDTDEDGRSLINSTRRLSLKIKRFALGEEEDRDIGKDPECKIS